jgi:hypothetical protein
MKAIQIPAIFIESDKEKVLTNSGVSKGLRSFLL